MTPLSLACTNGNGAMVELLLDGRRRSERAPCPAARPPLMTAARTGAVAVGEGAARRAAPTSTRKDERRGQTALMWAAAEGHAAVVAGADRRPAPTSAARLPSGFTPLLFAVREGRLDVVRVLLKAGADVNETDPGRRRTPARLRRAGCRAPGTSPLLVAVTNAHFELAAALLDAGADPNADLPGYTALHAITAVRKPGVGDNDPAARGVRDA